MTARFEMHDRQARLLAPRMSDITALVAGAGMVGSWASLALVRAVDAVHVWDDDKVEGVNVGVQAYDGLHIGQFKADAVASMAQDPPIVGHVGRFPDDPVVEELLSELRMEDTVVACAVDSMAGRRQIAEWSRDHEVGLFIETGVHAELVVVKTATSAEDYERYLAALSSDDEVEEAQCGLKGTAYAGMSLASQIVPLVNGWAWGRPIPAMRLFHTGFFLPIDTPGQDREEVPSES